MGTFHQASHLCLRMFLLLLPPAILALVFNYEYSVIEVGLLE